MYERLVIQILLYHGTVSKHVDSIVNNGVLLTEGSKYVDFGPGFYTTSSEDFAINTAKFRTFRENERHPEANYKAVVVSFECDMERLKQLRIKEFETASNSWGRFVIANRAHRKYVRESTVHNCDQRFDCVIGPTADGKSGTIDKLVELVETGKVPLYRIKCGSIFPSNHGVWGDQYSFHTNEAISCLRLKNVVYYD